MGHTEMDAIAVLRMSADVAERLRTAPPDAGRVHSIFERVVNLAWHDGRLLTLQGPGRLCAPFAAEMPRLPRARSVRPGANVRRQGDTLSLDGVSVEWQGALITDSTMPERAGAPAPALSVLLAESFARSASGLSSTIGRRARSRLAEGLGRRDPEAFIEGARGLLGLGEGLTPAGDDCLVGTLAVIHRFARAWPRAHPEIEASVGTAAATRTTVIAREFVVHALGGHFAESLIDLLIAESADEVGRAATRLLRTGATSGADTLAGVTLGLVALGVARA
jgi:hypothetical protein